LYASALVIGKPPERRADERPARMTVILDRKRIESTLIQMPVGGHELLTSEIDRKMVMKFRAEAGSLDTD
jgi:hypothetical protein